MGGNIIPMLTSQGLEYGDEPERCPAPPIVTVATGAMWENLDAYRRPHGSGQRAPVFNLSTTAGGRS